MILYLEFAYGHQFSEEQIGMLICYMVVKKGTVSGFAGGMPLQTLDSRSKRNHIACAFYDFHL